MRCTMETKKRESYRMSPPGPNTNENERRQGERREMKSDGFAYITTVGWICRREQCRRNGDELFV
jgi:hypothetical protein